MKSLNFPRSSGPAAVIIIVGLISTSCGKVIIQRGGSAQFSEEVVGGSSSGTTSTTSTDGTSSTTSTSGGTSSSSSGGNTQDQVTCYQDQYNEPAAPSGTGSCGKVDMLFVVSTAASLDPYRAEISDSIRSFISNLPGCIDFRFGVMLAHATDNWSGTLYPGCFGPLVLDPNEQSADLIADEISNRITVVPGELATDGGEAFFISLTRSLQQPNLSIIQDEGFYRADASLQVVTLTARNDICWTPVDYPGGAMPATDPDYATVMSERAALCTGYGSAQTSSLLQTFKAPEPVGGASFAFTPASTIPSGTDDVIGYTMMSFMNELGGMNIPLDQSQVFTPDLETLAQSTEISSGLVTSFQLRTTEALLNPATLTATYNGQSEQYSLDSSTMVLTLPGVQIGYGSVVDIDYCTIPQATQP